MRQLAYKITGYAFLLLFAFSCSSNQPDAQIPDVETTLKYRLSLAVDEGKIFITLKFKSDSSGITPLELPTQWFKPKEKPSLEIVGFENIKKYHLSNEDSSILIVESNPITEIALSYVINSRSESSFPSVHNTYATKISNDLLFFLGENVLVYPEVCESVNISTSIIWENVPENWVCINSLGAYSEIQIEESITGRNIEGLLFMGSSALRVNSIHAGTTKIELATVGRWPSSDGAMLSVVKDAVTYQKLFWKDSSLSRYVVAMVPYAEVNQTTAYLGRSIHNSFIAFSTRNVTFENLRDLFHHEFIHHWIGHKITNAEPEELMYWFSEGFTSYFTDLSLLNTRSITAGDFKQRVNQVLSYHYGRSINTAQNSAILKQFHSDILIQKIPYNRGYVIAFYLDMNIRKHSNNSKTLKDAMLSILAYCSQHKQKLDVNLFTELLKPYTFLNLTRLISLNIEAGEFISIDELNDQNQSFEMSTIEVFDLGFKVKDAKLTKGALITAVNSYSEAAKAGLMSGDILMGWDIAIGETNRSVHLKVKRLGVVVPITYYPSRAQAVPQLNKVILGFE